MLLSNLDNIGLFIIIQNTGTNMQVKIDLINKTWS